MAADWQEPMVPQRIMWPSTYVTEDDGNSMYVSSVLLENGNTQVCSQKDFSGTLQFA